MQQMAQEPSTHSRTRAVRGGVAAGLQLSPTAKLKKKPHIF
jgi:hypothetical protein